MNPYALEMTKSRMFAVPGCLACLGTAAVLLSGCIQEQSTTSTVESETTCTDEIDNDGDQLIDNQDGDCWIREGAVFQDEFSPTRSFDELSTISPILLEIGVKAIELFPIWDHPYYFTPEWSIFTRWGVRDYSKLDPDRGTEQDLMNFIDIAHNNGLKIIPFLEMTTTFPPSDVCKDRIIPGYRLYYDTDGIGGATFQFQMANPTQNILLKNLNGEFDCAPTGYGFVTNQDSPDFISLMKNLYGTQILNRNFDGLRLDAPVVNHCMIGDKIDLAGIVHPPVA